MFFTVFALAAFTVPPLRTAIANYVLEYNEKYIKIDITSDDNKSSYAKQRNNFVQHTLYEVIRQAADELQDKLGIPVVVVSANLKNFDKAYTFLGGLLGAELKASELAEYYREAFDEAAAISAGIEEKKTIYYAYLDNGLTTEFAGSPNAELIELVGGVNIA